MDPQQNVYRGFDGGPSKADAAPAEDGGAPNRFPDAAFDASPPPPDDDAGQTWLDAGWGLDGGDGGDDGGTTTGGTADGGGTTAGGTGGGMTGTSGGSTGSTTGTSGATTGSTGSSTGTSGTTGTTGTSGTTGGNGGDACRNHGDCSDLTNECARGVCVAGQCSRVARREGRACDTDGDQCTLDRCVAGQCHNVATVGCSFLDDACEVGVCNPSNGQCITEPLGNGGACTDGDGCTYGSQCGDTGCAGGHQLDPRTGCENFVEEQEPNDGQSSPDQPLTGPVEIVATLSSADEDWFVFDVPANTALRLWTDDASGGCQVDTVVETYDADLALLGVNDDGGVGLCSDLTLPISRQARQLFVRLRGYLGGNTGLYVLHVETDTFQLVRESAAHASAHSCQLIESGEAVDAQLEAGENDWYCFDVPAGGSALSAETLTADSVCRLDTLMHLYSASSSRPVALDDDAGDGVCSRLQRNLPAGRYLARVSGYTAQVAGGYLFALSLD